MRARASIELIVGFLGLAWLGASLACHSPSSSSSAAVEQPAPTPNTTSYSALLEALDDPGGEQAALVELRRLVVEIEAKQDARARADAATVLLPGLADRWPRASASVREGALAAALALAGPEAAPLWRLAIAEGNPTELKLALEGLARAPLAELGEGLRARFDREIASVAADDEAQLRRLALLIRALGDLRVASAVEPLIRILEGPPPPDMISRELVSALGRIGDPRAVEILIVVQLRLPDVPGTLSIGERALRALGAIGEPALPGLLVTLAGNNRRVNDLAAEQGIDPQLVRLLMLKTLGIIGSSRATEPILASFPRAGCGRSQPPDNPWEIATERAFHANALGFIADPAAVPTLCACNGVSKDPTDVWEIAAALGRIGGEPAMRCLLELVERGSYDPDAVEAGMELEIRWQAFRWAVLAAPPSQADALLKLRDRASKAVRERIQREQLDVGLALLQQCRDDAVCYRGALEDPGLHSFARELAAFYLARRASPGDLDLAAAIAAAFATPDPEVRIHMAWLTAKVAAGRACSECIRNLERVMTIEDKTKPPIMQGAWITARQTIDKLHAGVK